MPSRRWIDKFADSLRGIRAGIRGQSSFAVHLSMAAGVIVVAAALRISLVEWCLVILCIIAVLAAELFNTAIERLAKEIEPNHNPNVSAALDIASAAVLLAALGAAVAGSLIFGHRLGVLLQWWS